MIEVRILKDGVDIGHITIDKVYDRDDDLADYSVRFAVERIGAVGLHQRAVQFFPRLQYNVLALLLQALNTLNPRELELEDEVSPSDLARRQRGVGTALSRQAHDPFGDN